MTQREILFRAKYQQSDDVNDLKWVYGYLCMGMIPNKAPMISIQTITETDTYFYANRHIIHHPETIGQFIGCNDIKGNKIFEGDILRDEEGNTGFVVFKKYASFEIEQITVIQSDWYSSFYDPDGRRFSWNELEIIGNIHDKKD